MSITLERFSMDSCSRDQVMKGLQELVPEITFLKKSEDFDGRSDGIWTSGESDWIFKGLPPFDHSVEYGDFSRSWTGDKKHSEMSINSMYVDGIHREIHSWLEERGWYPEWYDGGTLFFWKTANE